MTPIKHFIELPTSNLLFAFFFPLPFSSFIFQKIVHNRVRCVRTDIYQYITLAFLLTDTIKSSLPIPFGTLRHDGRTEMIASSSFLILEVRKTILWGGGLHYSCLLSVLLSLAVMMMMYCHINDTITPCKRNETMRYPV